MQQQCLSNQAGRCCSCCQSWKRKRFKKVCNCTALWVLKAQQHFLTGSQILDFCNFLPLFRLLGNPWTFYPYQFNHLPYFMPKDLLQEYMMWMPSVLSNENTPSGPSWAVALSIGHSYFHIHHNGYEFHMVLFIFIYDHIGMRGLTSFRSDLKGLQVL